MSYETLFLFKVNAIIVNFMSISYIDRKNIEQIEHDNIGLQKQTRWSIKTKSVRIFFRLVCSTYILQHNGDLLRPFVWYHMIANSHELNLKCLCQYNDCIVYLCIVSPTQARTKRIYKKNSNMNTHKAYTIPLKGGAGLSAEWIWLEVWLRSLAFSRTSVN